MSARFNANFFALPYAGKHSFYGISDADILDNILRRNVTAEFNGFDDDNVIRRIIRNNDFATTNGVGRFNTLDNAYFGSRNNRLGLNQRAFDDFELARQARRFDVDAFDIDFDRQSLGPFNTRRNNILAQGLTQGLDPVEVEYVLRRQAQRQANIGGGRFGGFGGFGDFNGLSGFQDDDDLVDAIRGSRFNRVGGLGFNSLGGLGFNNRGNVFADLDDDLQERAMVRALLNNRRNRRFGNFDDEVQQQAILRALLNNRGNGRLNNFGIFNRVGRFNRFGNLDDDLLDDEVQQQVLLHALLNNRRNGGLNNFDGLNNSGIFNRIGRLNRFGNFDDDLLNTTTGLTDFDILNRRGRRFNNRFNNPRGNPFVDDDIQTERELHRGLRQLNRAAQATRAAGASVIRIADIMQDSTDAVHEKIMDCTGAGLDFGGRW